MVILDLSHDVLLYLDEVRQALGDSASSLAGIALRFEPEVGMRVEELIEKLTALEQAIEKGDYERIAEIRDAVEAYNDYLDTEMVRALSPGGGPTRYFDLLRHLRVWKRSAGKLGEGLSLMSMESMDQSFAAGL
jgi:hypothetical protein